MKTRNIGFLHPGAMGVSLAASAQRSGYKAFWASEGRSAETRERAQAHHLTDIHSIREMCTTCSFIVSICPPHAAEGVARDVLDNAFEGLYLEANAIAPQRARRIAQMMESAGISVVDGGIIGGPAWHPGKTWLYLSGKYAKRAAAIFEKGPLETAIIGETAGRASALKMCYAAYTKGTTALLCAILAAAERLEVRDELSKAWSLDEPSFPQETESRLRRVTAKAWRFEGEMKEIAETFGNAGMPTGFHLAAAEIFHRLADFKKTSETPPLTEVLEALLEQE